MMEGVIGLLLSQNPDPRTKLSTLNFVNKGAALAIVLAAAGPRPSGR
jgi:hypothetical protein